MSGIERDDLDRRLAGFFESASAEALPDGLLDDVYGVTRRAPQRRGRLARALATLQGRTGRAFAPAPAASVLVAGALLLLALVAALVLVAGARHVTPAPFSGPAGNGRIVYDLDGQLVAVEPDGATRTLQVGLGKSWNPTFSPDGTKLAFWSQAAERTPLTLFVASADGSGARPVSGPEGAVGSTLGAIAWSPDGTRLAYASSAGGRGAAVYVAAADGSRVTRITPDDGADRTSPAWSPRGDLLAWRRLPAGSQTAELAVAAPDGSGERALVTSDVRAAAFMASQWAPDGSRIAYARVVDGRLALGVADLAGDERLLTDPAAWDAGAPAWSNDGTRIATAPSIGGVVVLDAATSDDRLIPAGLADCGVAWSPDDTTLLGLGRDCTAVYRIPVDDPAAATRLTQAPGEVVNAGWQRVAP